MAGEGTDGVDMDELEGALDALEHSGDPLAVSLIAAFDAVCSAVVELYHQRILPQRSLPGRGGHC